MINEESEEAKLVQYLLDREEIVLPTILLKNKMISELEKALKKERPVIVSNFFNNVYKNFNEYINTKEIDIFLQIVNDIKSLSIKKELSEDDKKIINFLVTQTKLKNQEVLEIIGQQHFTFQVAEELEEKKDSLSEIIKITLCMWCFVNLYESLLHNIDRRLLSYLKTEKQEGRDIEIFNKINRKEYKDHATAELINKVLCKILKLEESNNSIFGKSSKPKLIRNKISHSNLIYDSEKKKIVLINGTEFSIEDFLKEYYAVFNFCFCWIESSLGNEFNKEKIISELKQMFKSLSNEYLKIERSGLQKEYQSYIIKLKREAGVENDATTNTNQNSKKSNKSQGDKK
jgi:hypothetical protein